MSGTGSSNCTSLVYRPAFIFIEFKCNIWRRFTQKWDTIQQYYGLTEECITRWKLLTSDCEPDI